jgi:hypothetical protein
MILEKCPEPEAGIPVLLALVEKRSSLRQVFDAFGKVGPKAEPSVLGFLNSTDFGMRIEAERTLKQMGTSEKKIRGQSIRDLEHSNEAVRKLAIDRLKRAKPDAEDAEETRRAYVVLEKWLDDPRLGRDAWETILSGWVSKEGLPILLEKLEKNERGGLEAPRIIERIASFKDPSSFEPLAVAFAKNPFLSEKQIYEAFVSFGPEAEDTAMKMVSNAKSAVNRTGLKILAEIGGPKSYTALTKEAPKLRKLDPGCVTQLNMTIAQIKTRLPQP